MGRVKRGATCGKEGEKRLTGKRLVAPLWLRMWPIISLGNLQMNDVFIGCYSRPLDGMRLCVPSEWARVFRADGGAAAFALGEGRLALTTRELAESATDGKELNLVSFKMDERGRVVLPQEFRQFLANAKTVLMVGKIGYIELKPCVLSPCSFIQVKNKENL